MLRLVYSNRTEELLDELASRVRAQQAAEGPLVPVRLVVPNASVEGYVRLGVAKAQGIAANLETSLLTRFAAELLSTPDARVADGDALEAMALALLLDDALVGEADLAPVRAYLHAAGGEPDTLDLRRVQLAGRVARVFEEYTYARAEMLAGWRRGLVLGPEHAETERWQRRLWQGMFGEGGLARQASPCVVPLHEAVAALDGAPRELPSAVHVFGFAHVARTFHALLEKLGARTEVVVYALAPCEGFWEDVDARDPAPLHLWGRPGREHVRALNASAGFDHEDRFVDPLEAGPRTLLRELQHQVLRREPQRRSAGSSPSGAEALHASADARRTAGGDASVTVLEHASVRRECEAVASAVWQMVKDDETLRFDDVAVLVPPGDAAAYAAHLPAAFRQAHEVPHQIVGLPPSEPGHVEEAVELLLALPLGRFSRAELLKLAVHPALVAGMNDVDPDRWLAWSDGLGVVHGADRGDHEGTYIDRDILNWDQGLKRLALGAFMAGDASGDATPFHCGNDAYVPHEVSGTEVHDAAAFGTLLRSLIADARFAQKATLTTAEWAGFLRVLVETYVTPASEAEADRLSYVLRRLQSLARVDLAGKKVGYRVACELARERLAAGAGGRGGEGVVVSTLAAARPIPFRVVFACGMGEGRFPAPDAEDPLDLRWTLRRPGDVTARERDRYAFLELLLGVRDRLVLSYVSRDPLTGDALAPSSVVQELAHAIASGAGVDPASLVRRHPLRRWDERYFPDLFGGAAGPSSREPAITGAESSLSRGAATPLGTMALPEARAEARTLALRRSLERTGARVSVHEVQVRAERAEIAWSQLAHHLCLAPLPPPVPWTETRVVVPMHALVKLLELPLQGWAKFRLGLDEVEDDDVIAREDEPFETEPRVETLLLREVLLGAAREKQPLDEAYDAVVRDRELRGQGPTGVFAKGERGDHLRALRAWETSLGEQGVAYDALRQHRFGRAGEHARADEVHEAVVLDVDFVDAAGVRRIVKAEVAGRALPLGAGRDASVTLSKRANEGKDEWAAAGRKRALLRALVDHAVLAASGVDAGRARRSVSVVATADVPVVDAEELPPLGEDAAKAWLRDRVRELLGEAHAYFFPCEAVFVHRGRSGATTVTSVLEEARDRMRGGDGPPALRSAYGPVPRPQEYPLPTEAAAQAMIATRFGVLWPDEGGPR
ncbi:MAG TPA: exodeoxyribonuclease V subunit gamma [Polyangiaceae bacterium]